MKIATGLGRNLTVDAYGYRLNFDLEHLLATYEVKNDDLYYGMCLLSAVDTVEGLDKGSGVTDISVVWQKSDECLICIQDSSRLWDKKFHYYHCREDSLEYYTVIEGNGNIDRCYYFRGTMNADEFGSCPGFDIVCSGQANFLGKKYFHVSDSLSIGLDGDPSVWGPALTSGPLCFLFNRDFKSRWMSVGLAAREGNCSFQRFDYGFKPEHVFRVHDSVVNTQSFSLAYYGKEEVSGRWESPHLVIQMDIDMDCAVGRYISWLRREGYLVSNEKRGYDWWKKPIFCGWHEQVARGASGITNNSRFLLEAGPGAKEQCTQQNYTQWLDVLKRNGIQPGTIIVDADWQAADSFYAVDEEKWPDLRGFVDDLHSRDQRVLLWFSAWSWDGVPPEECMLINGEPAAFDPTNPLFVERLKDAIHRMLSSDEGCYNADGLKIDGTSVQPGGYESHNHGNIWGHDLLRHLLTTIYDESKKVKEDALISVYIANPYYEDVIDMVRLGDLYTAEGDPRGAMENRARIVRLAMPQMLIDTDGAFRFDMRGDYSGLIRFQASLGIPTLYQADKLCRLRTFNIPKHECLGAEDYARISQCLNDYIAANTEKC